MGHKKCFENRTNRRTLNFVEISNGKNSATGINSSSEHSPHDKCDKRSIANVHSYATPIRYIVVVDDSSSFTLNAIYKELVLESPRR